MAFVVPLATVFCVGVLLFMQTSVVQAVDKGDSVDDVIAELGRPRGTASGQHGATFFYERGLVSFSEGKVTHTSVVSKKEAKEIAAKREQEMTLKSATELKASKQRIIDGSTERKKTLANKEFMQSSAKKRLTYWKDFQKKYPEVAVDKELTAARNEVRELQRDSRSSGGESAIDKLASEIAETKQELRRLRNVRGLKITEYKRRNEALRDKLENLEKQQQQLLARAR
jgi:outer membrane protein assembly factor BamE (lipoprotein component of BamABCDE complex)